MKTQVVTLPAFEATPNDVRLWDGIPPVITQSVTMRMVYILNTLPTFPTPGHVRSPDMYGATGAEFKGTEILPAAAVVQSNVGFGSSGSEFIGTLGGGTGSAKRRGVRMF